MMTERVHSEEFAVKGMGKPSQRMPVVLLQGSKSPNNGVPSQACLHVRIFCDVILVVVADKRISCSRGIHKEGCDHDQRTAEERKTSAFLIHPKLRFYHGTRSHNPSGSGSAAHTQGRCARTQRVLAGRMRSRQVRSTGCFDPSVSPTTYWTEQLSVEHP